MGDPEKAVNAYNDLLDKGMQMLCGATTSGSCIAVGAEAAESTFLFTPSATAVDSITAGSNEFRMCFTDPAQGAKSAQYIGEHGLATKVAVLYDSMADYNSGVHDSFVEAAEENGLEAVSYTHLVSIRMVQRKQEPMMKAGKTLITAMDIKLEMTKIHEKSIKKQK